MNGRSVTSLCLVVAGGCFGLSSGARAELPNESTLPGRRPAAATLPAEAKLPPGFSVAQVRIDPVSLPAEGDNTAPFSTPPESTEPVQTPSAAATALPGESILPPASQISAPTEVDDGELGPAGADVLNLSQSADVVPWLRLDMKGHTGPVRAVAFTGDSARLCSAGEDKSVLVWQRPEPQGRWKYERSIYWQVQRGSRGRIYALALSDNLIALGGHGAMGGLGEILLVDAVTGNLKTALYDEQAGHRQVIVSLAFSPDPERPGLASIDRAGKALYWQPDPQTGLWKPREIQQTDAAHYGAAIAERLRGVRGLHRW